MDEILSSVLQMLWQLLCQVSEVFNIANLSLKAGVILEIVKYIKVLRAVIYELLLHVYKSIHLWNGNESKIESIFSIKFHKKKKKADFFLRK